MLVKNTLALLLLLSLSANMPSAKAKMYKWIDAEGNTHYTQTPPNDIESTAIKPPPKVNSEASLKKLRQQEENLRGLRDERLKKADNAAKQKQEQKEKKELCEKARLRLAGYQRPRVAVEDGAGNVERISEEKRQAEIAKSKEYVDQFCQ